jgi:hypothetical protein
VPAGSVYQQQADVRPGIMCGLAAMDRDLML